MELPELSNLAGDEDRRQIAQMLHDGPCQVFSGAQLLAEVLLRDAEAGIVGDPALHRELAAGIKAGVNELHQVMVELRSGKRQAGKANSPPQKPNQR